HIRHKFLSAMLSKDLKKKYRKNAFPLRKGDAVVVMRGKFKKKEGRIKDVSLKKARIKIEGLYITKKDGTNIDVSFDPSKLMIKELNLEDKERIAALNRGGKNASEDKHHS
ncbi:50S ribosomal protein L24, partial [Candidatus Pacearchaeota archaeon]|nr:50S ribosomal protein L24 [Candidatus Pacearchaeota archaeon]